MADNKNKVYIELYDAPLTQRKDDRTGRVLSTGSASVDDLINDAVSRGTDINPDTLRASYNLLKTCALGRIGRSQRVEFGLGITYIEPTGVFIGDGAKWDPTKNQLVAHILPSKELRETLKSFDVEVLGMAQVPNIINGVTDVFTGQENICLTRGGMVHVTGNKIKIAGVNPDTGLKLRQLSNDQVWTIPETAIGINDPSRVSFVVPTDLPNDEYQLYIVTQYSNGTKDLKNPRTLTLDYNLTIA
jgi:hypothetical protein